MALSFDTLGYYFGITNLIGNMSLAAGIFIAGCLLVFDFALLRYSARQVARWLISPSAEWWGFLLRLLALMLLGGYGCISGFLFQAEGPRIVRDGLVTMVIATNNLDEAAKSELRVPEYEALTGRVAEELRLLRSEISNPTQGNYCGIGAAATAIIKKISQDLPGVRVLTGTDVLHSCGDKEYIQNLDATYENMVDGELGHLPLVLQYRILDRQRVLRSIEDSSTSTVSNLVSLANEMDGVYLFGSRIDLYRRAVQALRQASNRYDFQYQELLGFFGPNSKLEIPHHVDLADALEIGSILGTPHIILSRLDLASTHLIMFFALLINGLAAAAGGGAILFDAVIADWRARRGVIIDNADVAYIFVVRRHRRQAQQ